LNARFDILVGIPGVGEAAASLAGLAPVARDSGQRGGKRLIRGGRAPLRQALDMPALLAVRFNATMKAKYDAFLSAGKPPKLGTTAIMRKIIILANALVRHDRAWTPKLA
jgi:transposase